MTIEQGLEKLKKTAIELSNIGDVKLYRQKNNKDFLQKWTTLRVLYQNICKHEKKVTPIWIESLNTILEIEDENPSMKEFIESLIIPKDAIKNNSSQNTSDDFDESALEGQIESYISQISNMQYYDPDEIEDIEWAITRCQSELAAHKDSFDSHLYTSLMDDISVALNKIAYAKNIIISQVNDSIKKM